MPTLLELADHCHNIGCAVGHEEAADVYVSRLAHLEDSAPGTLSWFRGIAADAHKFRGSAVVARRGQWPLDADPPALVIMHEDPRSIMRSLINTFFPPPVKTQIERGPGCMVHYTAVLAANGQGYDWREELAGWDPFPHAGGLRLGSGVDIGPCSTIMRGSVGDTVIGDGCKIGNGVNIGHDTRIGRNTLIVAGAQIAGWVRIGERVRIWQGAMIKNGVRIGDGAQIGMGAVVLNDVRAGETWVGSPARCVS
ncbi:MAG TPA: DapH/DapD/GlmU-related protein [Myxococcota bacterium]